MPEIPLSLPPVTLPSNSGQKKQLSWLIPTAVVILAAGGCLGYYLYTEKKAFAEQTVQLEKDTEALSETITLLHQKQEEARKGNQTKLLKEKENIRLLETLQKKEKAVEQIRQKHNSVLAEQSNAIKRIEALEKELGESTRNNIEIPRNGGNFVECVNSSTVKAPMINPPCPGNRQEPVTKQPCLPKGTQTRNRRCAFRSLCPLLQLPVRQQSGSFQGNSYK